MDGGDRNVSALVGDRIREELGRRRVTRQWLADRARISLSTLEKALAGQRPFSTATLVRIEEALGLALRETAPGKGGSAAPDALGAYTRAAVHWLENDYCTVRPSFETIGAIYAYRTRIAWDETKGQLSFFEHDRADAPYAQRGDVALPHQSGHIYLITREAGQFRLAILARPTIDGRLFGLLTTLQAAGGSRLVPVSCPLALVPLSACDPTLGLVRPGEVDFAMLADHLERIETEGFARLVSASPLAP
jgi:transcriptional regulator with XRE-family HTH domain